MDHSHLEIGKKYACFKHKHDGVFQQFVDSFDGDRVSFPFNEETGIFINVVKSGWLRFQLSGSRECIINPDDSYFELICDCGNLIDHTIPELLRTNLCEFCLDAQQ